MHGSPANAHAALSFRILALLCLLCGALALIDIRRGIIPDGLNLSIAGLGLAKARSSAAMRPVSKPSAKALPSEWSSGCCGGLYFALRKIQGLGLGDVKFLAAAASGSASSGFRCCCDRRADGAGLARCCNWPDAIDAPDVAAVRSVSGDRPAARAGCAAMAVLLSRQGQTFIDRSPSWRRRHQAHRTRQQRTSPLDCPPGCGNVEHGGLLILFHGHFAGPGSHAASSPDNPRRPSTAAPPWSTDREKSRNLPRRWRWCRPGKRRRLDLLLSRRRRLDGRGFGGDRRRRRTARRREDRSLARARQLRERNGPQRIGAQRALRRGAAARRRARSSPARPVSEDCRSVRQTACRRRDRRPARRSRSWSPRPRRDATAPTMSRPIVKLRIIWHLAIARTPPSRIRNLPVSEPDSVERGLDHELIDEQERHPGFEIVEQLLQLRLLDFAARDHAEKPGLRLTCPAHRAGSTAHCRRISPPRRRPAAAASRPRS